MTIFHKGTNLHGQCGVMAMVKDNLLILNFVSLHMFAKFGQHPICGVKGFKNSYHSFFIDT